jgi:hypothetical protein
MIKKLVLEKGESFSAAAVILSNFIYLSLPHVSIFIVAHPVPLYRISFFRSTSEVPYRQYASGDVPPLLLLLVFLCALLIIYDFLKRAH